MTIQTVNLLLSQIQLKKVQPQAQVKKVNMMS